MKLKGTSIWGFLLLCACSGKDSENIQPSVTSNEIPQIVINEILASNHTSFQDPDGTGEYDDWIELHNSSNKAVNIGGMYISDSKRNQLKYRIPDTNPSITTIQPGGYLLLWADSQIEQGILHLDFKLSAEGEDIGIYDKESRTVDEITFGAQSPDVSTGRSPKNSEIWTVFPIPTPGAAN